jgi:hypothetical protein
MLSDIQIKGLAIATLNFSQTLQQEPVDSLTVLWGRGIKAELDLAGG